MISLLLEKWNLIQQVYQNNVHLEWQTITENGNIGFVVQRKSEETNYTDIALVEGEGTSTEKHAYT